MDFRKVPIDKAALLDKSYQMAWVSSGAQMAHKAIDRGHSPLFIFQILVNVYVTSNREYLHS